MISIISVLVSVSDPDPNPDPHSMGYWIRIQKGENLLIKRRKKVMSVDQKNMKISIVYSVIF
jgi:hypothetical protein